MNRMLILIATLFLTACGTVTEDRTSSSNSAKQTQGKASPNQPSGVDVKVNKNGKTLTAFQSASDNTGVGALLGKDDLSIEITSPDQNWVLTISVSRAKAGVYRLAALREEGKAMILLTGGQTR